MEGLTKKAIRDLTEKVKEYLIKNNNPANYKVYNEFINECKANGIIQQEFYDAILSKASNEIKWEKENDDVKSKIKKPIILKEETEEQKELKKKEAQIILEKMVEKTFHKERILQNELSLLFKKAVKLGFNEKETAIKLDQQIKNKKLRAFPDANFDLESLEGILTSTNWYDEEAYKRVVLEESEKNRRAEKRAKLLGCIWGIICLLAIIAITSFITYLIISGKNKKENRLEATTNIIDSIYTAFDVYENPKYPVTSSKLLTQDDLENLLKHELYIMRNEIYARHGLIFQNKKLKKYFDKQPWYKPRYNDVSNMLSETEKKNIAFLKKVEDSEPK